MLPKHEHLSLNHQESSQVGSNSSHYFFKKIRVREFTMSQHGAQRKLQKIFIAVASHGKLK